MRSRASGDAASAGATTSRSAIIGFDSYRYQMLAI
jgi:hypothetical protein